jgi:hypothetical protein
MSKIDDAADRVKDATDKAADATKDAAKKTCAPSISFAGADNYFCRLRDRQRRVAHHLAALGYVSGRSVAVVEEQRRSADRRAGAWSAPGTAAPGSTWCTRRRPVHRAGSVGGRGSVGPRRFARSVR